MNLMRYNPMRDLDTFFDRFSRPLWTEDSLQSLTRSDWMPSVDISETDEEFLIEVEVPEIRKEDINIQVNKGMLTISGERKQEKEDKKQHRMERYYGAFSRSFSLPDNVREDGISADQKDGMLYLHLRKAEERKPKKLEIKVA
jgi:HSP20 family protein